MAKRFSDTELWDEEWFMELPQKHKLLFQFLFAKCDAAGVWSPNYILASNYIGSKISKEDLKSLTKQIHILPNGKIFLVGFIEFQYGKLTETCMPHRKVLGLLEKHGISERVLKGYRKGIDTLEEEEEYKEEEEDKDKEEEKEEKTKRKKTEPQTVALPFDTPTFIHNWQIWKDYKKQQHDFKYKSPISEQAAINDLVKISDGTEQNMIDLIHYAISKTYKGIFPIPKNNTQNGQQTANNKQPTGGNIDVQSAFNKIDQLFNQTG